MSDGQISATPFQSLLADHDVEDLKNALVVSDNKIAPPDNAAAAAPPLSVYTPTRYESEKRQGLRRKNGARKLKKLTNRHLKIITRHLEGRSGEQIAEEMGVTFVTVSRVLNDPLAVNLISNVYRDRQGEIDALAGKAIDAVRTGLDDPSPRVQLSAVTSFTKLKDSIGKEETTTKTAEDVVQDIFNRISIAGDANIQLNIGKDDG